MRTSQSQPTSPLVKHLRSFLCLPDRAEPVQTQRERRTLRTALDGQLFLPGIAEPWTWNSRREA